LKVETSSFSTNSTIGGEQEVPGIKDNDNPQRFLPQFPPPIEKVDDKDKNENRKIILSFINDSLLIAFMRNMLQILQL
jgi:hypothetical protein